MYQYYIIEIQKFHDGSYAHLVHYEYDEDPDIARDKGESKYHAVLTAAAVSNTAMHGATLISADGKPRRNECYVHNQGGDANADT